MLKQSFFFQHKKLHCDDVSALGSGTLSTVWVQASEGLPSIQTPYKIWLRLMLFAYCKVSGMGIGMQYSDVWETLDVKGEAVVLWWSYFHLTWVSPHCKVSGSKQGKKASAYRNWNAFFLSLHVLHILQRFMLHSVPLNTVGWESMSRNDNLLCILCCFNLHNYGIIRGITFRTPEHLKALCFTFVRTSLYQELTLSILYFIPCVFWFSGSLWPNRPEVIAFPWLRQLF